MNKTLYARLHLNECTVVSHDDNFAVNVVADFEIGVKVVPWMGHKLLETESDAFFLIIEIDDNDFDVLIKLNDFAGIGYAAPAEVCDVNETVNHG